MSPITRYERERRRTKAIRRGWQLLLPHTPGEEKPLFPRQHSRRKRSAGSGSARSGSGSSLLVRGGRDIPGRKRHRLLLCLNKASLSCSHTGER